MKYENKVKKKLAAGGTAWGAGTVIASDLAAKWAAGTGVDFIWIDTEHMHFATESIHMMPIMVRASGAMPMVRVSNLDPGLIKKALDIGASAVMIPQVDNAQQAELVVKYAKYPPQGNRGISPMWSFYMDISWEDYLPHANDETMVVVQVETKEALSKVEEIAAVEGVDVVLAGPMDLSAAHDHIGQISHPSVQKFLEEFPARVTKQGKTAGIALGSYESAVIAWKRGFRFINFANILHDGVRGIKADLARLRELTGEV
ncbi:MAG: 4-hydroxy-2-oxo-heptane-1,7-dioate aldolase [Candidatus Solibacter usitatus]|nr:4-hydroxy-2-oxo-heptane-1,7-dioate aldolase [Candidatus Solibacter usitatus]